MLQLDYNTQTIFCQQIGVKNVKKRFTDNLKVESKALCIVYGIFVHGTNSTILPQ